MGFQNDPNKPKILRTKLDEQTLKKFKALSVMQGITMAEYMEELILKELKAVDHIRWLKENNFS
jgi:DNA-binding MltR family transcriptional regulator